MSSQTADEKRIGPSLCKDALFPSLLACLWWGGAIVLSVAPVIRAASTPRESVFERSFESTVRPLLLARCAGCHGPTKASSGLRVDSRESLLTGGKWGAVIIPGNPHDSLLIRTLNAPNSRVDVRAAHAMAPGELQTLSQWITEGAVWPEAGEALVAARRRPTIEEGRRHWAYQPLTHPAAPPVRDHNWCVNAVDQFILAALEKSTLKPNGKAEPRELVRRAYFDLIGLPPTPEEAAAFEIDSSPDAWSHLIDRLLARPEYGERWARYWLDVVRYADSNGYEYDYDKPLAWQYRDYVVNALNNDKPYNRFILEQLAGDELEDRTDESIIATGFYRVGSRDDEPDDKLRAEADQLDDQLCVIGSAFMGLTIGCARCHDHKFEPISQNEYFQFANFIGNIRPYDNPKYLPGNAVLVPLDEAKTRWAMAVTEKLPKRRGPAFPLRGNPERPSESQRAAVPEVIGGAEPPPHPKKTSPGLRRALAEWMVTTNQGLTARVISNRLWQYHFDKGIVATADDLGTAGAKPTHPELLDWLAGELMRGGWSLKQMHRLIMNSATYQMSSRLNSAAQELDPENALVSRQNLRRLEAEAIRDSVLQVSGQLNLKAGGASFYPSVSPEILAGSHRPGSGWHLSSESERNRRSLYMFIKRTMMIPQMQIFDYATADQALPVRPVTIVASQALVLLHDQFSRRAASAMAKRVAQEAGDSAEAQVTRAFQLAMQRSPTRDEMKSALAFVYEQQTILSKAPRREILAPRIPSSITAEYLDELGPRRIFEGLSAEWSQHRGKWTSYENMLSVDAECEPYLLYEPIALREGRVATRLKLGANGFSVGLMMSCIPADHLMKGYELSVDVRSGVCSIRRHDGEAISELATSHVPFQSEVWIDLSLQREGNRLRATIGSGRPSRIEAVDPRPIDQVGHAGLRVWGTEATIDSLSIQPGNAAATRVLASRIPSDVEVKAAAMASYCAVLMNLNEFVYID